MPIAEKFSGTKKKKEVRVYVISPRMISNNGGSRLHELFVILFLLDVKNDFLAASSLCSKITVLMVHMYLHI